MAAVEVAPQCRRRRCRRAAARRGGRCRGRGGASPSAGASRCTTSRSPSSVTASTTGDCPDIGAGLGGTSTVPERSTPPTRAVTVNQVTREGPSPARPPRRPTGSGRRPTGSRSRRRLPRRRASTPRASAVTCSGCSREVDPLDAHEQVDVAALRGRDGADHVGAEAGFVVGEQAYLGGELDRAPHGHRQPVVGELRREVVAQPVELGGQCLDVVAPALTGQPEQRPGGRPQLQLAWRVDELDQAEPRGLVGAFGVRDEARQLDVVPVPEPAVRQRSASQGGADRSRLSRAPSRRGRGLGRAPYARWPRSWANTATGRSRTSTVASGSRWARVGEQSQSSFSTSRSRRAKSRVKALLASVRSAACSTPAGRTAVGASWLSACERRSHGSGSPSCSRMPDARSEPLTASDPASSSSACGSSRSQPRSSTMWSPAAALTPSFTAAYDVATGALARNRGSSGRPARTPTDRADQGLEQPVGLSADRGEALLDPVSGLDDHDHGDQTYLGARNPGQSADGLQQARARRAGHEAQRRTPGRTEAGSGRHAGHRNDACRAQRRSPVRAPVCELPLEQLADSPSVASLSSDRRRRGTGRRRPAGSAGRPRPSR